MVIVLALLAVVVLFCVFQIYKFSTLKLYAGQVEAIDPSEIPESQIQTLIRVEKRLVKMGFFSKCHVSRSKVIHGQEWGVYGAVYYNEVNRSYAFIAVEPNLHPSLECRLYFINVATGSVIYETLSGSDFPLEGYPDSIHINDALTIDNQKQWESHVQFLSEQASDVDQFQVLNEPQILEVCERVFFAGLIEGGALKEYGDHYKIKPLFAVSLFKRTLWVQRKLGIQKKGVEQTGGVELDQESASVGQQVEAYETYKKIQEGNKSGAYTKTLLLLGSVVLFGASFGLGFGFSFQTLIILIAVLFVHELGHLFGMWMFGYRDLKMFFVPFLGALASGKKENIQPWQEAIVLILGPLPGYILGVSLLFNSGADLPVWIYEYALMSLILNALNLLPFMPLDGGRLVNLGLFNRLPRLQLAFYIVSIVVFLLAGVAWGEPVGYVIGVLLLLGLPNLNKEIRFLRNILASKVHKDYQGVNSLIETVKNDSAWKATTPINRWQIIDSLNYRVQHAKASAMAMVGIMAMWALSITLPVYMALGEEGRTNAGNFLSLVLGGSYEQESIESLEEKYIESTSHEEKVKHLSQLVVRLSFEDKEKGLLYWGEYRDLGLDLSVGENESAELLLNLARKCHFYEKENCEMNYYERLSGLDAARLKNSDQIIEALLYLSEFGTSSLDEKLSMLSRVGNQVDRLSVKSMIPSTLSRASRVYYLHDEFDLSYEFGVRAIKHSQDISPDYSFSYLIDLINVFAHTGDFEGALHLIDEWKPKLSNKNSGWISIDQDMTFVEAQVASLNDRNRARDLLGEVEAKNEVDSIRLSLAKFFLEEDAEIKENISASVSKKISVIHGNDQHLLNQLAHQIRQSNSNTNELYGDNELSYLSNIWYSEMKKVVDQNEFAEVKAMLYSLPLYDDY